MFLVANLSFHRLFMLTEHLQPNIRDNILLYRYICRIVENTTGEQFSLLHCLLYCIIYFPYIFSVLECGDLSVRLCRYLPEKPRAKLCIKEHNKIKHLYAVILSICFGTKDKKKARSLLIKKL